MFPTSARSSLSTKGQEHGSGSSKKKQAIHAAKSRHPSGSDAPALPDLLRLVAFPASSTSSLLPSLQSASSDSSTQISDSTMSSRLLLQSSSSLSTSPSSALGRRILLNDAAAKIATRAAQRENDAMIYLEGTGHIVYSCAHCRTHLTSHEDILSKSFHGRLGRAYLFDSCVNVLIGEAEDRMLITGLHSVCDLNCKRCNHLVGWTYQRAYEASQKYKEGKFIIEKIHLYVEHEDDEAGGDGFSMRSKKMRSHSWGNAKDGSSAKEESSSSLVYEYEPAEGSQRAREKG